MFVPKIFVVVIPPVEDAFVKYKFVAVNPDDEAFPNVV